MKTSFPKEVAIYGETKSPTKTPTVNQDTTINLLEGNSINREDQKYLSPSREASLWLQVT